VRIHEDEDYETVKTGCIFRPRNNGDDCGNNDGMAPLLKKNDPEEMCLGYIWIQDVRNDVGILKTLRQRTSDTEIEGAMCNTT
jgi:hypothetical protein